MVGRPGCLLMLIYLSFGRSARLSVSLAVCLSFGRSVGRSYWQGRLNQVRGPSHKGLCGDPQTSIFFYLMYLPFQLALECVGPSQRQGVGSYLLSIQYIRIIGLIFLS